MNNQNTRKRAVGTGLVIGIVIGLVAMFSIRCNKEDNPSPVSFTPAPAPTFNSTTSGSSGNNNPNPAPPAPAPAPSPDPNSPAKLRYSSDVLSKDGLFQVEITSTGSTSGRVGVACYENPHKTTGERQIYFSSKVQTLPQGATRTPQAKIPQCVYWQCDGFEGDAITGPAGEEIDVFYGRRFLVGRSGGPQGNDCGPPPECENPPCNPPPECDIGQLERDATAECVHGFNLNILACTFECKPPPSCEELFEVDVQIDDHIAWIFLKNMQGVTVGSEHRQLTSSPQSGEVCVGQGQETLRMSLDNGPCCLPWELPPLPPPECVEEELQIEAEAACEFGVESLNLDECTFECLDEPVCDAEELQIEAEDTCEFGVDFLDLDECEFECLEEPECVLPDIGTVESFTGPGDPDTECEAFGDFMAAEEGDEIDFLICKAGNDREVVPLNFVPHSHIDFLTCPSNGKSVSHITECICSEDDDSSEE